MGLMGLMEQRSPIGLMGLMSPMSLMGQRSPIGLKGIFDEERAPQHKRYLLPALALLFHMLKK